MRIRSAVLAGLAIALIGGCKDVEFSREPRAAPAFAVLGTCRYPGAPFPQVCPGPRYVCIVWRWSLDPEDPAGKPPPTPVAWVELIDPLTCTVKAKWTYTGPVTLVDLREAGACIVEEGGPTSLVDGAGTMRWTTLVQMRFEPVGGVVPGKRIVLWNAAEIVCLDRETGGTLWRREGQGTGRPWLAWQGNALYWIAAPSVWRLDPATGGKVWEARLPALLETNRCTELQTAGAGVFFLSADGHIGKADATSGEVLFPWVSPTKSYSELAVGGTYVAACGTDRNSMTAWDPGTGVELWSSVPPAGETLPWSLVGSGERAVYVGSQSGVVALSTADGRVLCSMAPKGPPCPPPDAHHGWWPRGLALEGGRAALVIMGMEVAVVNDAGQVGLRFNTPGPITEQWVVGERFYLTADPGIGMTRGQPSLYVVGFERSGGEGGE